MEVEQSDRRIKKHQASGNGLSRLYSCILHLKWVNQKEANIYCVSLNQNSDAVTRIQTVTNSISKPQQNVKIFSHRAKLISICF